MYMHCVLKHQTLYCMTFFAVSMETASVIHLFNMQLACPSWCSQEI